MHLIIQTSFLGDTVLTTPLIAYLAERGRVDIVVTPASAALLGNNPALGDVIVYDKRGSDSGIAGFVRLARKLRARGYETAYLAQGSMRSGALAVAAGIARRVGFVTSAGRRFYTELRDAPENEHHASRLLRLGMAKGTAPAPEKLRPRLYPGSADRAAVDALLSEAGLSSEPFVVLAPGSVWATKRWPYYADLAASLAAHVRIAVVGSAADGELARSIVEACHGRALDATGRLSLLASAELIRRASAIVTNDSSPLHLASAMGTPTVAVFGPTVPEFGFGPLAPRSSVVGHEALPCRPCDRHGPERCPLGHWRCMREITPAHVEELVLGLLPSPGAPAPPLPEHA